MSTKIHAAVDGLGNLARFRLTGRERHDITEAANLIEGMQNVGAVVADKAFDANSLLEVIESALNNPFQGTAKRRNSV